MDKNDFDVDFDFSKDLGFDPDELLGSDDPGEFDMSQYDDDDLNLSELLGEEASSDEENFQDYNMDEEELRSEGDFEPYPPDQTPEQGEDADYGESEDLGEDLFFPKRSRRNDGQGDDGERMTPKALSRRTAIPKTTTPRPTIQRIMPPKKAAKTTGTWIPMHPASLWMSPAPGRTGRS